MRYEAHFGKKRGGRTEKSITFASMKHTILTFLFILPSLTWAQSTLSTLEQMHQIKKGETIETVATRYGVTALDILEANPQLEIKHNGKLKKGTLIMIPQKPTLQETNIQATEPVAVSVENTCYKHVKAAILLPFEEKTDRAQKMVEFYQGLLMAADSVKKEGTDIDLYALHCGSSEQEMQDVLNGNELTDMTVIFGPANQAQVPILADFCTQHGIRLVLPFAAPNASLKEHPLMYQATTSAANLQQGMAEKIGNAFADRNYIVLKTNQASEKCMTSIECLKQKLHEQGTEMRQMPIDGDDFAIESALNQFKVNCIIPDDLSIKTLNIFFSRIQEFQKEHSQYEIVLLGYPEWQTYTNSLLAKFFEFDTLIYSAYYRNPLEERAAQFDRCFVDNFHRMMQPSYPQFGMMGFDLGYYFLHGLASTGDTFERRQANLSYHPFQNPFFFVRDNEGNGFTNMAVMLIHYTKNQTIEIAQ